MMGILKHLLGFPVTLPVAGALWVVDRVREAAESELSDPAAIRRALAVLEARLDAGEIDDATYEAEETVLLDRLEALRGGGR